MRIIIIKIIVFFFLFIATVSYAYAAQLVGKVYETTSKRGIATLTVRLIPPRNVSIPRKITSTDDQGNYRFSNVSRGWYLIEVYQGVTRLYIDLVEITQDLRKDIPLRKK